MRTTDTIIIIPAYNEEKSIHKVVSSIKKDYPTYDIVVIDDGSYDSTREKALLAGALVLSHPFNLGYGVAIQTGYKYALQNNYDYLVQIDGDGQHDTTDISVLLDNLKDDSCEIVLGSRYLVSCDYKTSIYRHIGTALFRKLILLFTREKITDPTTGFQAMTQNVLTIFVKDFFPCDYPDADVIILLSKLGIKLKEVPVKMYCNDDGKSMHSNPIGILYYVFKMILSMAVTLFRKY